jgi:hypothetical protein
MGIGPTAGSILAIGTTETIASPDDYTTVGEIADLGSFGRVYQEIIAQSIGTRGDRKFKGTYNDGQMTIKVNRDYADEGQADVETALDSDSDYNFRVTLNDNADGGFTNPTYITFKAKVMQFPLELGGPNSIMSGNIVLSLKSGSITVVPAN